MLIIGTVLTGQFDGTRVDAINDAHFLAAGSNNIHMFPDTSDTDVSTFSRFQFPDFSFTKSTVFSIPVAILLPAFFTASATTVPACDSFSETDLAIASLLKNSILELSLDMTIG